MSTIAAVARIVLGVVFIAAGGTKISRGRDWSEEAAALGTPKAVAPALPWVELVLGATVVAGVLNPWPSVIAIGLLAAFTAWIVAHLSAGRHPPCACFGALSTAPLSWRHVGRNAGLIAVGVVAALA